MAAGQISRNCFQISPLQQQIVVTVGTSFMFRTGLRHIQPTTSSKRLSLVKASKPRGGANSSNAEEFAVSQEDLKYLVKLGVGSVAGAAAIKYGSIIFPEVTQPNLGQALIMVFAPVILAIFILIKQTRTD